MIEKTWTFTNNDKEIDFDSVERPWKEDGFNNGERSWKEDGFEMGERAWSEGSFGKGEREWKENGFSSEERIWGEEHFVMKDADSKGGRYNAILRNEVYISSIRSVEQYEKDRVFGHHDMAHFLDVARVGMLINLTEDYRIDKELIYAAALLHDVGRAEEYKEGTPHDVASVKLAGKILEDTLYTEEEKSQILEAIGNHRNAGIRQEKSLSGLLYRADKESRPCYFCIAEKECNWKPDKKNKELIW